MSRIGRKPVPVPGQREGLDRRLDDPGRRPQGEAQLHPPARDRRRTMTQAERQVEVTRQRRRATQPIAAWTDPQPGGQHGPGGHQPATPRSSRSSASATRRSSRRPTRVALQVGYANQVVLEAPPGVTVTVARPHPRHHQRRRQAGRRPVRRRRPRGPAARALQGQGNSLRGRGRPPQGRQGLRFQVITMASAPGWARVGRQTRKLLRLDC